MNYFFLITIFINVLLLSACGKKIVSEYTSPEVYPERTQTYQLSKQEIYADPMNGLGLRYQDKIKPGSHFDVNIYPVGSLYWQQLAPLIDGEVAVILADRDYTISQGLWQEKRDVLRTPVTIAGQAGVRLQWYLWSPQKIQHEIIFLFLQHDKWVKISFFKITARYAAADALNVAQQAEAAVWQVLPEIHAPPESALVAQKRAEHAEKIKTRAEELLRARSVAP
jgi:hypothetical protein